MLFSANYHQTRQTMIRNFSGHLPMIGFIRDGIDHLRKAANTPSFPPAELKKLMDLFRLAHSCLLFFCIGNPENQDLLAESLPLFLANFDLDIGQIPLIIEICRDNKLICEANVDTIISALSSAITTCGRNTAFLELFIVSHILTAVFNMF